MSIGPVRETTERPDFEFGPGSAADIEMRQSKYFNDIVEKASLANKSI